VKIDARYEKKKTGVGSMRTGRRRRRSRGGGAGAGAGEEEEERKQEQEEEEEQEQEQDVSDRDPREENEKLLKKIKGGYYRVPDEFVFTHFKRRDGRSVKSPRFACRITERCVS